MEAYNQGVSFEKKHEQLVNGSGKGIDDGINSQLSVIQNHNRAANRNEISQPIIVKKEFLTFDAKQAVLNRLVDKVYDAKTVARVNNIVTAQEVASQLTSLKIQVLILILLRLRENGSSMKIQKTDLDKIINSDPSYISVDYVNANGKTRTINISAQRLFRHVASDYKYSKIKF